MSKINFTLEKANGSEALELNYERVFAIGYAGRNMEKTMEHIKELEEQLGVPAPKRHPHHLSVWQLHPDSGEGPALCGREDLW